MKGVKTPPQIRVFMRLALLLLVFSGPYLARMKRQGKNQHHALTRVKAERVLVRSKECAEAAGLHLEGHVHALLTFVATHLCLRL